MQQVTTRDHHQSAVVRPGLGEGDDSLCELEGAVARVLVLVSVGVSADSDEDEGEDSDFDS
jgi:hypothetical protein